MAKTTKNKKFTFIDLFAGCGGLSEGFYRQGFKAVAHVEIDHYACETLRERMRYYGYKNIDKEVVEGDITSPDIISRIDEAVNGREVDMIIGGPPCQAYSTAGRVRDKKGMENDARNFLFESYVKILEHYLPKLLYDTFCLCISDRAPKRDPVLFFVCVFRNCSCLLCLVTN